MSPWRVGGSRPRGRRRLVLGISLATVVAVAAWFLVPRFFETKPQAAPATFVNTGFSLVIAQDHRGDAFDPISSYAASVLAEMTLEEKIRSLLMLHYPGTDTATLHAFIVNHNVGGFILMGNNIPESPADLSTLTAALSVDPQLPALVAIDEEGGYVTRLPYDGFAGANTLRNEDPSATLAAFSGRAELLKSAGINVNFGVDADVTGDPQSFIFDRTFGNTPDQAALRVAAAVGGEKSLVASTLKHFPGHGSTTGDSHVSIPATAMSFDQWQSTDAVPFAAGIAAGAAMVMFGHLAFTAVDAAPASLSSAWHTILREKLGFKGIAITDDMTMLQGSGLPEYGDPVENAVSALAAGNDMLLYVLAADPSNDGIDPEAIVTGLVGAVKSGRIAEGQVEASALRVLTLRRSFAPEALMWTVPCPAPCRGLVEALPAK